MSDRDGPFEDDFLEAAERSVGVWGSQYAERVRDRLERGQHRFGDRWRAQGMDKLVAEVREEGLDLAGWSVLAAQLTFIEQEARLLDPETALLVRLKLQQIAALGAKADALAAEALDAYRAARGD